LTRKKSLDFDIVEWGELVLLSAGVGSWVGCNSWTQDHVWKCFRKQWNCDVNLIHSFRDWALLVILRSDVSNWSKMQSKAFCLYYALHFKSLIVRT
jgi:hypothetical protein